MKLYNIEWINWNYNCYLVFGRSHFHYAIDNNGYFEVVSLLLSHGANIHDRVNVSYWY